MSKSRSDVAYNHTNVKIVGVSAGVSYGPLGCTHTSLHDIAGMRALPGLSVFVPADAVQTRFLTRWLTGYEGPAFLRMGRGDVESVYGEEETFQVGKAKLARQGSDVTLAACGECVWQALQAAELLAQRGVSARVLDFFSIKPFDEEAVIRAAEETGAILTVEEHSVCGGPGRAGGPHGGGKQAGAREDSRIPGFGMPCGRFRGSVPGLRPDGGGHCGSGPCAFSARGGDIMALFLSIDQSTSVTKGLVWDSEGRLLARADVPHRQLTNDLGWVGHDPMEILRNTLRARRPGR